MIRMDHTLFYLSILLSYPFMFYLMLPVSNKALIFSILILFVLFIFKHHNKILFHKNNDIVFILLIQMLFFFTYGTFKIDYASLNYVFQVLTVLIFFIYFFKVREDYTTFFSKLYVKMHVYMVTIGVIGFFLILLGILHHVSSHAHGGYNSTMYNYILTFTNEGARFGNGYVEFIRMSGYYDEPGAFAYYITYAIVINRLTLNNKKYETILSILGFFTFSVAFIIILVILNYRFFIKFKNLSYILIIFLVLYMVYISVPKEYTYFIDTLVFDRFEVSDDGHMQGDNRSQAMSQGFIIFLEKPILGYGFDEVKNLGFDPSNIVGFLVSYGIVGFIFYFLHVFYMMFLALQFNFFKIGYMFFALLLNYVQRPNVMGLYNELTILLLILILKQKKIVKPTKKNLVG